ncbi:sex hormone-binding globulin [Gouania willdenowi]|uniref:sex hormone-binding globulin n=1 Tax=Gouania willdenowi TaxID=441366 RepID=UPI001056530B|nr:sex hormone-binding globulin [Gouania willdenowi]
MSVLWKVLAGGLLFLLSPGYGHGKKEVAGSSTFYLGQRREIWTPLVQTTVNFSQINSIKSCFQFRTFDPEGAIFYGDTKGGEDWFVLSLRKGIPLMQISKLGMLVSAAGGPKLNDGRWHTLEVSNQGQFVILEVDGSDGLTVGMQSKDYQDVIGGHLRLAVGGILISREELSIQFEPQMDGCVREGIWLNLSVPWETETEELWPCYQNIQPGSYFPGTGLAIFNTSVFTMNEDKEVTIDLKGDFSMMNGTILSILVPGQEVMFTLVAHNHTQDMTITYGEWKMNLKNNLRGLSIKLGEDTLFLHGDEDDLNSFVSSTPVSHPAYPELWRNSLLAIGGLLGEGNDNVGSQFLTGCLKEIKIQGVDLDLDLAVRHGSISSHSCPA